MSGLAEKVRVRVGQLRISRLAGIVLVVLISASVSVGAYTATRILRQTSPTPQRVTDLTEVVGKLEDVVATIQRERAERLVASCETYHRIAEAFRRNAATLVAAAGAASAQTGRVPTPAEQDQIGAFLRNVDEDATVIDCDPNDPPMPAPLTLR